MDDRDLLTRLGFPAETAEPIGAGVEGSVFALGPDLVGKVWHTAGVDEVRGKQAFYDELAEARLPFATPLIEQVTEVDGTTVSVERRLPGITLKAALEAGLIPIGRAYDIQVDIVRSLAGTVAGPRAERLRVMEDAAPFRGPDETWPRALARLITQRGRRFGAVLGAQVEDFDAKLERVEEGLLSRTADRNAFVHGDLVPDNILVDDRLDQRGRLLGVLDWSFFTVAGDNVFEASVAAGIFDMYGDDARVHDDLLMARLHQEYGYPPDLMRLYRLAYAIATANAFSADGSEGHFAWCVRQLERPDLWDW